MPEMTIRDLEEAIWRLDGIRVVVRGSDPAPRVLAFEHKNRASDGQNITTWLDNRVFYYLRGVKDVQVDVVQGDGTILGHWGTHVGTVRKTYS